MCISYGHSIMSLTGRPGRGGQALCYWFKGRSFPSIPAYTHFIDDKTEARREELFGALRAGLRGATRAGTPAVPSEAHA